MPRRTKEEAELTYKGLLDAAAKLFIRQGVAKTTLNTIAIEAGVTRGAIYHHFENKDAVIQALWERNGEKLLQIIESLLASSTSNKPAEGFREGIKGFLRQVANDPEVGQMMRIIVHNVEFTDEETPLQSFLLEQKEAFYEKVREAFVNLKARNALRVELPPELLTLSLMSYIYGLVHEYLSPNNVKLNLNGDGEALTDLFLDSVLSD